MDFQKRTIRLSRLDLVAADLKNQKCNPQITLLGRIKGRGLNDLIAHRESYKIYDIRRLDYMDFIIVEQFIQTKDMELDDFVVSKKFNKENLPDKWHIRVTK